MALPLFDHDPAVLFAFRATSTYPQQLAALAAGRTSDYLDNLFLSSFPDATQRRQFVEQFMRDRGLSTV
jgi:hypothetical protein